MRQTVRNKVFETNSSSIHTLTIIDKDTYDKFESGELWFCRDNEELVSKKDILNMPDFKNDCPNYNKLSKKDKEKALNDFIENNVDNDYSLLSTYDWVDIKYIDCYDKNGNPMIAVGIYLPG